MRLETTGLTRVATRATPREDVVVKVSEEEEEQCSTSSSSSIGKNSDVSSERSMAEDDDSEENEVESAYKYNGPLHAMETLEQVLPIRRGISEFYIGKSKSFTSLADAAASPSVKDIAKPENAYSRRRRNLMAFNHVLDKNRNYSPLRSNSGGISKRTISSSRSALALALAMNNSDSSSSITSEDSTSSSNSSPLLLLPRLHPRNGVSSSVASPSSPLQQNFSAWRSFSAADLQQHCAIAATIKVAGSSLGNETAHPS